MKSSANIEVQVIVYPVSPFLANVLISYSLKIPENLWFSCIFGGNKMGTLTRNGLRMDVSNVTIFIPNVIQALRHSGWPRTNLENILFFWKNPYGIAKNFCFSDVTLTSFDDSSINLLIFSNFFNDTKARKCNVAMCLYIFFADVTDFSSIWQKHSWNNKPHVLKCLLECHFNYNVSKQKKIVGENDDLSKPQWAWHVIWRYI